MTLTSELHVNIWAICHQVYICPILILFLSLLIVITSNHISCRTCPSSDFGHPCAMTKRASELAEIWKLTEVAKLIVKVPTNNAAPLKCASLACLYASQAWECDLDISLSLTFLQSDPYQNLKCKEEYGTKLRRIG